MNFKVRKALLQDAHGIAEAHVATWKAIYKNLIHQSHLEALSIEERQRKWEESLRKTGNEYIVFVVEDGNKIIGFANFGFPDDVERPHEAELYAIYLHPDYHGKGVGSLLFKAFREKVTAMGCRKFCCWVFKGHNQGHEFYKRMGGRLISKSEKQLIIGDRPYPIVSYEWIVL